MSTAIFYGSISFVLYAYLGYPLVLMLLSLFRHRPVRKATISPSVSFIIAAHNEEKCIRRKLENTLRQEYARDALEIIVASDCSTDATDDIVKSFAPHSIRLICAPIRGGKEAAQKLAVEGAKGDLLIFSDAATTLPPDAVSSIVNNFADPTVGCVSSVDRVINPQGGINAEGAYIRYEMFIRNLETNVNTLVGLSGSFFAARREVCKEWAVDLQSDFNTLLNAVKTGLRGVADPEAIGYYQHALDERKEFDRKTRTVVRGIAVLMKSFPLLNPFRYGLFSWQLFSHKLCKWLVPFALIAAFLSNASLALVSVNYAVLFALQCAFYGLAIAGLGRNSLARLGILRLPSFLLLSNLSILRAWGRYLRGDRSTSWAPTRH